jgi:hypothetical protein
MDRQKDKQTQMDRQKDKQTQMDRQTDERTDIINSARKEKKKKYTDLT